MAFRSSALGENLMPRSLIRSATCAGGHSALKKGENFVFAQTSWIHGSRLGFVLNGQVEFGLHVGRVGGNNLDVVIFPPVSGRGSDQNSAACEVCGRMLAGDPLILTTGMPVLSMATPRMTTVDSFNSRVWFSPAPGGDDSTIAGGEGGATGLGGGAGATGCTMTGAGGGAGGFTSAITPSKFNSVL